MRPVPIALDADQGYVRGPLVVSGSTLSLAAYDHDGDSFTYPPSRIVQLDDRTFHENGRTEPAGRDPVDRRRLTARVGW